MARSYGVLKISVWEPQSDFRQLSPLAQWAYTMLISQPQINNLGIVPYTPEKWRRFAAGLKTSTLDRALSELATKRYTIVDVDTGELLVRTFIKHDAVWRQPKLVTNARKLIREVESDTIHDHLIGCHPWLEEPWTKEQIETFEAPTEAILGAAPIGVSKGVSEGVSEPLSEGVSKGVSTQRAPTQGAQRPRKARGAGPGSRGSSSTRSSTSSSTKDHDDDEMIENEQDLTHLKPTPDQLARWTALIRSDPQRFNACLTTARAKGRNAAAYLDTLIRNGSHPDTETAPTIIDVNDAALRYIAGQGWDETTDEDAIRDELAKLNRSRKTTGTLDIDAALELWRDERARRYPELAASPSAPPTSPSSRKKGSV